MQISQSAFDVLHLLKFTDIELYSFYLLSTDLSDFTLAGTYERYIVSFDSNTQRKYSVKVLRVRQRGDMARRTFSLRPDWLLPNSSFSIRFILSVIYHYLFTRDCSIPDFVDHWQISRSTLYIWLDLFKTCSHKWLKALSDSEKTARDIKSRKTSIPASPRSFLSLFGYDFFESFTVPIIQNIKPP